MTSLETTNDPPSSSSLSTNEILCEICQQQPFKYKCPRCDIRSCSVTCVKQHKADRSCSGERSKTHYVPLKKYNENNMMSDYVYLEDVSRHADTIARQRLREKQHKPVRKTEYKARSLAKQIIKAGIIYDQLPIGMSRQKKNQTNYSTKLKEIFWTVEFCFCLDNRQERILEHSCANTKSLKAIMENMLFKENPQGRNSYATIRCQLQHFIQTDMSDWVIGLKKEGGKRNTYINLTSLFDQSIMECLRGERVIEYPTIYIWLNHDFESSSIDMEEKHTQLDDSNNEIPLEGQKDTGTDNGNGDKCDAIGSDSSDSDIDDNHLEDEISEQTVTENAPRNIVNAE